MRAFHKSLGKEEYHVGQARKARCDRLYFYESEAQNHPNEGGQDDSGRIACWILVE